MVVLIEGALGVMSPQIHGSSVLGLPGIHSVELLQGDGLSSGEGFSLGGVGLDWGLHSEVHLLFWDIDILVVSRNSWVWVVGLLSVDLVVSGGSNTLLKGISSGGVGRVSGSNISSLGSFESLLGGNNTSSGFLSWDESGIGVTKRV